ncbi:UNKNOWN [Stylonychia lemnae]|uniref:Uncharacterized protein n=1 Tax=Stylonychia lemnae TaxID=5949 RepID=A0A077ZQB4_STYLE|nr:UNKNOWN [Stylonychia lemnae]|eukprot:CDW71649.1 UNKNOWN [Stylonychia lemnae]
MGNRFCCTAPNPKNIENSPFFNQTRFTLAKKEQKQIDFLNNLRQQSFSARDFQDQLPKKKVKDSQKLKFVEAFSISIGETPIKFLSFSQRKFIGFRNQYEFDRKRLLIASTSGFCIVGYDIDEKPQVLINTSVSENEQIEYIGFIDDEKPQNVLLITKHLIRNKMIIRMLKIKKENERSFAAVMEDIELQRQMQELVRNKLINGEASEPRSSYDNYNLFLDQDLDQFKRDTVKPYIKDVLETQESQTMNTQLSTQKSVNDPLNFEQLQNNHNLIKAMGDGDLLEPFSDEDDNNNRFQTQPDERNTSNTHNTLPDTNERQTEDDIFDFQLQLPSNRESRSSSINEYQRLKKLRENNKFTFTGTDGTITENIDVNTRFSTEEFKKFMRAKQSQQIVYQIYEIQEQSLKESDLAGCSGFSAINYYNYSQFKKLVFCISPDNTFFSYLINHKLHDQIKTQIQPNENQQQSNQSSASKSYGNLKPPTPKSILNKEPILINTHHTQYYGKIFQNNYQYKKIKFDGAVQSLDFAMERLYIIYNENSYEDTSSSTQEQMVNMKYVLDVAQVNGILCNRYDIYDCFKDHGLELVRLTFVQIPQLKWSTRQANLQGFGNSSIAGGETLKKIVLTGEVLYLKQRRCFIMIFNLEENQAETIKIIDTNAEISCINYGPYDNGHILVGLTDGKLIAFDYLTLERLESVKIFDDIAITSITFDPTNYIFVGSETGKLICLSYIDKKMHYLYLDLGKNKFCTVQLARNQTPDLKTENKIGYQHVKGNSICCV